jgi:predicted RND superfamily exporter protein
MTGKIIHKYNAVILVLTLVVTSISIYLFPSLKTEVSFKSFFSKEEPAFQDYERFTEKMGSSENTLVVALTNKPTVFDSSFLRKLQVLQRLTDSIPEVKSTTSILTLKKYHELMPGYFTKRPYLQPSHPERFAKDSILLFGDFPIFQHFITKDAKWTKLLIQVRDNISLGGTDSLIHKIDTIAINLGIGNTHILGRKYMESEFKKLVNHELKVSLILSLALVVLILFLMHRSFAGVLVPVLCMSVSLIMLYGYMALFKRPLTIMSNLFPTIILIVGISDVIHISSKFAFQSLQSKDPIDAITKTLKEIGLTTFINSFTTAIGFLTLLTMSMQALQSFGVDAAVGLMIAWVNSIFLLPALLVRFKLASAFTNPIKSRSWDKLLYWIFNITQTYSKRIILFFSVILIISIAGCLYINTNNYVLTSLPKDNRLRNDYAFFDNNMGGGRTFELIIKARGTHRIFDASALQNIKKLETYLEKEMGVSEIISPVLVAEWLNKVVNSDPAWRLPPSQNEFSRIEPYLTDNSKILPIKISDSSGVTGGLYGRIKDKGRRTIEGSYGLMNTWIKQNIDTTSVQFEVTGVDYVTDVGQQLRIDNMTGSFLLEILVVSIIIGVIYRSGLLVLIAFVANIIPVIIVGGVMGFLNIELRGATTAIFAIGYVIAVDDTLHFINRFQVEKRKGPTTKEALLNTLLYTGRALIITAMILLGGFLVLIHSSFGDVFMHGFLVSLIILTGLISELLLTPIMLQYFFSDERKKTRTEKKALPEELTSETL